MAIVNKPGTVTLMGSGEFSETMGKAYRSILARIQDPNAVFLDTPAGFELNADEISARAARYFELKLNLPLATASYKSRSAPSGIEMEAALRLLHHANLVLAGPGSPSYAVHEWRGSSVWETLQARLAAGAHLMFASAAAIAVSRHALPVYEIYKAGHPVRWMEGLDLLGPYGLNLAIVPHWNNEEGGTYDTHYCFMGEPRLRVLEQQLAYDTIMLGIDENTACILDLDARRCAVMGAGGVTIRYRGQEWPHGSGESFPFETLFPDRLVESNEPAQASEPVLDTTGSAADARLVSTSRYLTELARAMQEAENPEDQRDLIDYTHDTMHELARDWRSADQITPAADISPYVELLLQTRTQLRAARQFALADEIRRQLSSLLIQIEDTPQGPRWHRTPDQ